MSRIADFSPNRLDPQWYAEHPVQHLREDICLFYSYAVAVSPLANVAEQDVLDALNTFWEHLNPNVFQGLGFSNRPSGFDAITAMQDQCDANVFAQIRGAIAFERMGNNPTRMETRLRENRATAMLALSYPKARAPHSIAIAFDENHGFFIRDSADPSGWGALRVDATGRSIAEAVQNRDGSAILGEAILFTEKAAPPPINYP